MNGQPDVRFVLVRPRDPRNVGAACRAMKTMGFTSLSVVLGEPIDPEQAGVLAHHARDVLEGALFCTDLEQAIGDAALVAGTTRRRGRERKYFTLFPEQLAGRAAAVASGTVAVLFGNEDTGLTDAELARCHLAVTIPSSPAFPSLNLSHAVQVIAYELPGRWNDPPARPSRPSAGARWTTSRGSWCARSPRSGSAGSAASTAWACSSATSWPGQASRPARRAGSAWCSARSRA